MIVRRRLFVAALASLVAPGCSTREASPAATGAETDAGTEATHRVVSVSPSATEAVFALGHGADLVGRSTYCDEPPEALAVPAIGGFADPNLERIVALAPTLVVGERGPAGPRLVEALGARGIATYFPPMSSLAEILAFLRGLGERLDAGAAAQRLVAGIETEVRNVEVAVAQRHRPKVLFLFDFEPIVAAGPGSFPDELLRRAGGDNVVHGGGIYPRLGAEAVLGLDPDLILDGSAPAEGARPAIDRLRAIPGLAKLRAVVGGHVRRLPGTAALRPGPRIGEGLSELARLVGDTPGAP